MDMSNISSHGLPRTIMAQVEDRLAALLAPLAITSAFGSPRNRRTWSGAPAGVANALSAHGLEVVGIDTSLSRFHHAWFAGMQMLQRYRQIETSEAIARGPAMRRYRAKALAREMKRLGVTRVLHTGTLDMPFEDDSGKVTRYLFCDHTWNLAIRHRPDADKFPASARRSIDDQERAAYAACRHIFTFGEYVRDDLIDHYGVPADKVTAVGSGMGDIQPFTGAKDYTRGRLLFVAKHYFYEKGGRLLLDAFRLAVQERPNLTLTIVGNEKARGSAARCPNVEFRSYIPWSELEALMREATVLVQPMLNDPWGQVYLEAMLSRTPVIGLDRNGLPEIAGHGRFGFLVDPATPEALARAIVEATDHPARLAEMAELGQRHVLDNYSWQKAGDRIWEVIARDDPAAALAHDKAKRSSLPN